MSDNEHDTPSIDDVVTDRPKGLLDPEVEPAPLLCRECAREYGWSWWGGRGRIPGRWCPPPIPCHACSLHRDMAAERLELNQRQERVGIAVAHRSYRWSLKGVQDPGETWTDFARSVGRQPGRIGVALPDLAAARTVSSWRPGHGGVYLHGPVGTGKSMWLSALVTDLIAPTVGSEVRLGVDEQLRLGVPESRARAAVEHGIDRWVRPAGLQTVGAMVVDEEDIVRRVGLAWKGDQVPLLAIARAQVLVYDDLGTVLLGGGGKSADLARTCMDRLIDLRWREHRPLLVTSNRSLDEVCGEVSERTASRLRALIDHEHELRGIPPEVVAAGYSWRRLPPEVR